MKKTSVLTFLLVAGVFLGLSAQIKTTGVVDVEKIENSNGPIMTIESMIIDYGTIDQNSEPLRVVNFTNTGTEPLIISNARGSCGCTVPSYPKEPIMPGQSSKIEIRYATNRIGKFSKTVTLTTNEGGQSHVLKVTGNVLKPTEEKGVPPSKNGLKIPNK